MRRKTRAIQPRRVRPLRLPAGRQIALGRGNLPDWQMADGLIGKTDAQIADAARSRQIIYLRNLCREYERVIMLCADEITKLHMQITDLERERRAEKR